MNEDIVIDTLATQSAGQIARIQLNRSKALNALTHDMCLTINQHLSRWAQDETILAVLITSTEERAFCAGGDIRHIYHQGREDIVGAQQFFSDEYAMNRTLYHFPKPYIALCNGVTMGGGAGISIHGSHPIATEKTVFAMPEARIGFFTDVGMSYHLARLPHRLGYYLALTGASIGPADCVNTGLMKAMIDSQCCQLFIDTLCAQTDMTASNIHARIDNVVAEFSQIPAKSPLQIDENLLEKIFAKQSVAGIVDSLTGYDDAWAKSALQQINANSPMSVKAIFSAVNEASNMTFDQVIERDTSLSREFLTYPDLYEGIRAMLIDKDRQPKWQSR